MFSRRALLAATLPAPAARTQADKSGMFADAAAYEGYMGRWSAMLAPLLVEFSGIGDRGRILDIGSGTGVLAFSIARAKPHCQVVGIDPSKEYIAYAESRNAFKERARFETG